MRSHPFFEVAADAEAKVKEGFIIHQQFICCRCGAGQTMATPNQFFYSGTCEECHAETNLLVTGCNYAAMIGIPTLRH
jgi:ribosomal protein S27AE